MERVPGEVLPQPRADRPDRARAPPGARTWHRWTPRRAARRRPGAVGLGDFGRPDGLPGPAGRRWRSSSTRSRSRDLPGIDELRDAARRERPGRAARPRSCTATTGWTTWSLGADDRVGAPCSTGRWPPSATRWPTWGCCSSTGTAGRSEPSRGTRSPTVDPARRLPHRRGADRAVRRAAATSTWAGCTGTSRSAASSSR